MHVKHFSLNLFEFTYSCWPCQALEAQPPTAADPLGSKIMEK